MEKRDRYPSTVPNLLSESKHGVGASLLTKNELGSIPSRTAIIEIHCQSELTDTNNQGDPLDLIQVLPELTGTRL